MMVDRRERAGWVHTSTHEHPSTEGVTQSSPRQPAPHRLPGLRIVPVIIGINICVFALWKLSHTNDEILQIANAHFLVSPVHLELGHYWTLLTSVFSHEALWHLAINMLVLYSFGSMLERLLGVRLFTAFYLAAGLVGSLSHCAVSHFVMHNDQIGALGASGAVCGLLMTFSLLFPKEKILIFGVIPVPALLGALGFVAIDIWGLMAQRAGGGLQIGHGAHLGGALCGALFFLLYLRPRAPMLMARLARPRLQLTPEEAVELQRLHRKVADEGRDRLTPKEQHFLSELRQRMQHREQDP